MLAAPIAKPEGKASSTAFVIGRSFIDVISVVIVGIFHARGRNPTPAEISRLSWERASLNHPAASVTHASHPSGGGALSPDLLEALRKFAGEAAAAGEPPAAEHTFPLDEVESLTAFRNLVDGAVVVSVARAIDRLDANAARALREAMLRLTAETRLGGAQVGLLEPDGAVSLAVELPAAVLDDAAALDALLDSIRARLAALSWAGAEAPQAVAQLARFEDTWIRA